MDSWYSQNWTRDWVFKKTCIVTVKIYKRRLFFLLFPWWIWDLVPCYCHPLQRVWFLLYFTYIIFLLPGNLKSDLNCWIKIVWRHFKIKCGMLDCASAPRWQKLFPLRMAELGLFQCKTTKLLFQQTTPILDYILLVF